MRIAVFASAAGSNAKEIIKNIHHFIGVSEGLVSLILTNNPNAGVIQVAKEYQIASEIISIKQKSEEDATEVYKTILNNYKIDFIVLAGYLKKIPIGIIKHFPKKIINIHPSLLPAYGGEGMYGMHVHEAVIAAQEKESGITIHFVDEIYDNGEIIFQAKCDVIKEDNATSLAQKVQSLEYEHFTRVISEVIKSQIAVK